MTIDADAYDAIATGAFAPLYPYYAGRIVETTKIRSGCCLDAGCGGGYLGLALAEITSLDFCFLDESQEMLRLAKNNILARGMSGRARTILGVVQKIPLPTACMDLVVSRGSVPFWDDLPSAFREIQRVLKPGGQAYIGGGLGTPEMRKAIEREMRQRDPGWQAGHRRNIPRHSELHYADSLMAAGVRRFNVAKGETGTWIEFQKETPEERTTP